jgi:hypothetical protein
MVASGSRDEFWASLGLTPMPHVIHPLRINACITLAYYVHRISLTGSTEKSRRSFQEDFLRVEGKGVAKQRRALVDGGWLRQLQRVEKTKGNEYSYGDLLKKKSDRDAWVLIGEILFGKQGLIGDWLKSPLLAHGSLGSNGVMVCSLIDRFSGRLRMADIRDFFAGVASPDAVDGWIKKLVSKQFVVLINDYLHLSEDFNKVIAEQHDLFSERKDKISKKAEIQRGNFLFALGVSRELQDLRKMYRGLPCIRCGSPSKEVEHFPPVEYLYHQKKAERDVRKNDEPDRRPDDWFMTFPICKACNEKTRKFITKHDAPLRHKFSGTRFHGGDPLVSLSRRITELRDNFYTAVENDETEKALRCVSQALGMFDAVSGVAGSIAFKLPSGDFLEFKPVSSEKGKERKFVLLSGESRRLSKEKPDPTEFVTILPLRAIDDASIKWGKKKRN